MDLNGNLATTFFYALNILRGVTQANMKALSAGSYKNLFFVPFIYLCSLFC